MTSLRPIIFRQGKYTSMDLDKLRKRDDFRKVVDIFENQLGELFEMRNARLIFRDNFVSEQKKFVKSELGDESDVRGNWVYYPWSGALIHVVGESEYSEIKTNRNRNLIEKDEQDKLNDFCVGFAGLSIGSNTAITLAHVGAMKCMKLAEFDTLETSNLNRLRGGVHQVGMAKMDVISQTLWEINPYTKLIQFREGLNEGNLDSFLVGGPKLDVIFDAIDSLKVKVLLRVKARELGIPVIMFTNLGDSVLVDVERYDLDRKLSLFNGRIGKVPEEILEADISKETVNEYVLKLVGVENIPGKAVESVHEIGKSLVGRPQLGSTVAVSGGIGVYLVKELVLGGNVESGRKLVKFSDILI